MSGTPTLTLDGGRATIALQRPDKRNRIEPADLVALVGHCDTIEADPMVEVVVIEAEGPSWCSGYHLGALAEGATTEYSFGDLCDRIETLAVPTIAALQGNVHGGGTDLAVSCDFRIGADHLVAAMPAARIGLQYYAGGLRRFVERIGPDATKRFFLTAETMSAEVLERLGFCTEVVPAAELDQRVDRLVSAIGELAPTALRQTKQAINDLSLSGAAADMEQIQAGHRASARSTEHREAMKTIQEKRRPDFTTAPGL